MTLYRLEDIDSDDYVRAAFSGTVPDVGVVEWINNTPGGGTQAPIGSLPVNPPNPYPGTYFVADQEDATDANANRAHWALAAGIDDLDNIMHRSLAIPAYVEWTPATDTNTYTISAANGPVYLGLPAVAGNYDHISLVKASDHAGVADGAGNRIYASVISPSIGDGTLVNDFSPGGNVVITWSDDVPGDGATTYRIYYGKKNSLGALARSDLSRLQVFNSEAVGAAVQQVLKLLHAPSAIGQDWNSPWQTTVYDLVFSGLDSRYRLHTDAYAFSTIYASLLKSIEWGIIHPLTSSTAGAGNWIMRDGMAPVSISNQGASDKYADKFEACWRALMMDDAGGTAGPTGFVSVGAGGVYQSIHDLRPTLASFLSTTLQELDNTDVYPVTAEPYTLLTDGGTGSAGNAVHATLGVDLVLVVDASDYFWASDGVGMRTAINCGVDMMELKGANGVTRVYSIFRLASTDATKCYLRELGGTVEDPCPLTNPVTYRWHSVTSYVSGGLSEWWWQKYWNDGHIFNDYTPPVSLTGAGYYQKPLVADGNAAGDVTPPMPYGMWGNRDTVIPVMWWGNRGQYILATTGQTASIPKGMLMPNGNVWAPGVFTNDLSRYEFYSPSDPLDVHCNLRLDTGWTVTTDGMFVDTLARRALSGDIQVLNNLAIVGATLKTDFMTVESGTEILVSGPIEFARRPTWHRTAANVAFDVAGKTYSAWVPDNNPYLDIYCTGLAAGGWTLDIEVDLAAVEIGSVYYLTVRMDRAPGDDLDITFSGTGGLIASAGIGQSFPHTLPGDASTESMTFRLMCASHGGNASAPIGKLLIVEMIGYRS